MGTKFFHDQPDGTTIELFRPFGLNNDKFAAQFPGITGKRFDSFSRLVGLPINGLRDADALPVTRKIQYKNSPSRHECDSRCTGAHGKTMNCECRCGGKNHGKHG